MVNISKRKLKPNVRTSILNQLARHIAVTRGDDKARNLLAELLTESEQIQLAKRLAVIILLVRGYSFSQVEKSLRISSATIVQYWKNLKLGKYDGLVGRDMIHGRTSREDTTLESILKLITEGLPPRAGKGRWKFLKGQ
jgi:uncharacterized protein YerC